MGLVSVNAIKKICQELDLRPSKNMGQHFLLDKGVVEKMAIAAELKPTETVLEIGPGLGILTTELIKHVGQVVAVEKDRRLVEYLIKTLKHKNIKTNLKVINNDILRFKIYDLGFKNYKIISNLPYQITSPVLWKFLMEEENKPELMVLMVQKEVAERICAQPGEMSVLGVMCQFYADCDFLFKVPRESFWPQPEVESAVIKLTTNNLQQTTNVNEKKFIRLVKIGFSARRKMLKNNLAGGLQLSMNKVIEMLQAVGLNEKVRAQELGVEEWIKLGNLVDNYKL